MLPDRLASSLTPSLLVELSGDGYMRGKWGHAQREKSSLLLRVGGRQEVRSQKEGSRGNGSTQSQTASQTSQC